MTAPETERAAFPVLSAIGNNTRQLIIKYLIEHCGEGQCRNYPNQQECHAKEHRCKPARALSGCGILETPAFRVSKENGERMQYPKGQ